MGLTENAIILNQIYNQHLYPYGDWKILEDHPLHDPCSKLIPVTDNKIHDDKLSTQILESNECDIRGSEAPLP